MPGRCPSCNQVYTDETLVFCPNDGAPINKEPPQLYSPQTGSGPVPPPAQPPSNYPPPPPAGYYAPQGAQAPPQGWQQPPYGQQPPPPYGQPYPPPQYGAPAKSNKLPLIIGLAALVLIGGVVGLYFLLSGNNSATSTTTTNSSTVTTSSSPSRNPGATTTTSTYPSPSTTTTTTTEGSYTDDEKHKLFQAVGRTGDSALIIEVAKKLGIADSNGQLNSNFGPFRDEHFKWAERNRAWVQEYFDPKKAREYVMANK